MSTLSAEPCCHVSAPSRAATRISVTSVDSRRRYRAIVMLTLFGFVLLRTLTICHEPGSPASDRIGARAAIDALIASAFCGTLDAPVDSRNGDTTSHRSSAMCLHCASGCHGATALETFWIVLAFGLALRHLMRINLDKAQSSAHHRDNKVRGPPAA